MTQDIGRQAVRGAAWLGSGQLVRQVIGFATTATLARLLSPDDFGLFGMTYVAAEFAQILTAFGFGAAIVQRQVTSPQVLNTCFWFNIGIGIGVGLLLVACGPLLSTYFRRAEIMGLLLPLALNMLVSAAMVVPQAILTQRMQFADMIKAQTLGSLIAAAAAVGAALAGAGYWSLAVQPLVGNLITGSMMMLYARWRPAGRPRRSDVDGMLNFSTNLLASNVITFFGRNMPVLMIGRQLGANALAVYSLASGITGTIIFQVSSVVVRVLFPTLSALKDEPRRLQTAWLRSCSAIAIIAFPTMAGTAAVAGDVVYVILGPQWVASAEPLRILCVAMAVQAVLTTSGTVLMALGRADRLFQIAIATTLATAAALWLGALHGIAGAATGYAVVAVMSYLVTTWLACRQAGLPLRQLLAELAPWALAAVAAGAAMAAAALPLDAWIPIARLAVCGAVGTVVYAASLMLFARARTFDLVSDIVSRLRG